MVKIIVIIPLFFAAVFPANVFADNWQKFENIMDNYYALDKQDYKSITCEVSAPMLVDSVKNIRQELSPLKEKLRITDTVNQYSMYFEKSAGLHINDPSFSIEIRSGPGKLDSRISGIAT